MPMRLTCKTLTFQCLVGKFLVGLTWKICVPFADDIIIISSTPEEHIEHIATFLNGFEEAT